MRLGDLLPQCAGIRSIFDGVSFFGLVLEHFDVGWFDILSELVTL